MLFWFFSTASKFRKTTRNRVVGLTNIGFTFEFPINNKKILSTQVLYDIYTAKIHSSLYKIQIYVDYFIFYVFYL